MRDSYPLQRCFHETQNTYHKIDSITFVSSVYRAQYAFATLNKVLFCCTRKVSREKHFDFRLMPGISCGCPVVIERQDQQTLFRYLAVH